MNKLKKIFKFFLLFLCRVAFPQVFGEFVSLEDHLSLMNVKPQITDHHVWKL